MLHFHTEHSEGITGLQRGECLSALVKTRGKCYLVLTYSLIHAHGGCLIVSELAPFTFSPDTVIHTVYAALQKSIAQLKVSPFLQGAGLHPSLTWIERCEDERIGCTQTIAARRAFSNGLNIFHTLSTGMLWSKGANDVGGTISCLVSAVLTLNYKDII